MTLMDKLVWQILQGSNKLWVKVLTAKYLKNESILDVTATVGSSALWKGILKTRDRLKEGFSFRVGNGDSSLWYDR